MARVFYTLVLWMLLPVMLLRLLWRARRQPAYLQQLGERFGFYSGAPHQPLIWLHAVSVGETRAAAPLIKALQQQYPDHGILLTHMTPTGRETGRQLFGDQVMQAYLPYDFPHATRRFLQHFQPRIGLLLETEIWPNLTHVCQRQRVPLLLVNARLSERSARRYQRIRALIRPALQKLSGIAAQTTADADRLTQLGADKITISGNLKFDISAPPEQIEQGRQWRQSFAQRPVWLAASTREGEEEIILDILEKLPPEILLVLVPRHPQRFDNIATLLRTRQQAFRRRTQSPPQQDTRVWLGDSMGELYSYYAASDVATIGGSILPYGGQNLIEACATGTPVLIGPHTENFEAIANDAISSGAAIRVNTIEQWADVLQQLLANPQKRHNMAQAGRQFAHQHQGATMRTIDLIKPYLADSATRQSG